MMPPPGPTDLSGVGAVRGVQCCPGEPKGSCYRAPPSTSNPSVGRVPEPDAQDVPLARCHLAARSARWQSSHGAGARLGTGSLWLPTVGEGVAADVGSVKGRGGGAEDRIAAKPGMEGGGERTEMKQQPQRLC
ncbi:unnamed protein product [Caretta caretta]